MTISATLDMIRARHSGCKTLAYADLSTRMILCASSADAPRQEYLDALCMTGVDMLDGDVSAQMAPAITCEAAPDIQHAVILQPHEIVVFVRSRLHREDAVFAICDPVADASELLTDLAHQVDQLGDADNGAAQ